MCCSNTEPLPIKATHHKKAQPLNTVTGSPGENLIEILFLFDLVGWGGAATRVLNWKRPCYAYSAPRLARPVADEFDGPYDLIGMLKGVKR